jgi:TPP-dependent pyruvate/acetoin dehydrogenase alpha subunit
LLSDDQLDAVDGEVRTIIEGVVEQARSAASPAPDELLRDVYASY